MFKDKNDYELKTFIKNVKKLLKENKGNKYYKEYKRIHKELLEEIKTRKKNNLDLDLYNYYEIKKGVKL